MLKNEIIKYFDGIEPDSELVERTVAMSNDTKNKKRMNLSKKMIALIAAIVCLLAVTTATATIVRVYNDKNNVVNINESDNSFSLDFTKAKRAPQKLSNTDNDIVNALTDKGFRDVIVPAALINDGYEITNAIDFLPQYTSAMFDFSNGTENTVSMTVIQDISDEDIPGFWETGDENSTGEVINVNGMDVVVTYMGDSEIGYSGIIFYANGNTIYQITYSGGLNEEQAKENILRFVTSLDEQ